MRPGPPRGATATLSVTVDGPVTAGSGQGPATYSTVALTRDVEQVCRRLLDPHLDADEVAVAVRLELLHRSPVPVGAQVTLTAAVASVRPTAVTCEILARHGGAIVARASLEQRVVTGDAFAAEVAARAG